MRSGKRPENKLGGWKSPRFARFSLSAILAVPLAPENAPLLHPIQWQVGMLRQHFHAEPGGLMSGHDSIGNVRRQESEIHDAVDIALIHPFARSNFEDIFCAP